jgi:SAM-dependent methyltransferase
MRRRDVLLGSPAWLSAAAVDPAEDSAAFWAPHERALIGSIAVPRRARVLDAGCGRGNHLAIWAERGVVTGVDANAERLREAGERLRGTAAERRVALREADLRSLPFAPASFDVAWASHVLHIVPDIEAGVRALRRVVRPGGLVLVRENRVNASLLPYDVGLGEPGLEARLDMAFLDWFTRDRRQRAAYPFGWAHALRAAELRDVTVRSLLFTVTPPFSDSQTRYLRHWLRVRGSRQGVAAADRSVVERLCEPGGPHDAFRRDDLHFSAVSTVYQGRA